MADKLVQCLLIIFLISIVKRCCGIPLSENVMDLRKVSGKLHHRVSRQALPSIDVGSEGIGDPPIVGSKTNRLLSNVLKDSEKLDTNYNAIRNNAAGPNSEQSVVTLETKSPSRLQTGGVPLGSPTSGVVGGPNPVDMTIGQAPGGPINSGAGIGIQVTGGNGGVPSGEINGALATSEVTLGGSPTVGALVGDRFGGSGGSLESAGSQGTSPPGAEAGGQTGLNGPGIGGVDPTGGLGGLGAPPPGGPPPGGLPPGSDPTVVGPPPPNNALNTGPASNTGSNANGVNGLTNANGGFGTNTGIGLNTITVLNLGDKDAKNPYRDGINININPGVSVDEKGKLASTQASIEASSLIGLGVKAAASALSLNIPDPHESSIAHDLKKITHILEHDKPKQYDELSVKKAHLIDEIEKETEKINAHHIDPHAQKPHFEDLHHKEARLRDEIKKETEKIEAHHINSHHSDPHHKDFHDPHQKNPYVDPHIIHKGEHPIESIKEDLHHIDPYAIDPHHVVYYNPYMQEPLEEYDPYFYDQIKNYYERRHSYVEDQIPQLEEIDRLAHLLESLRHMDPYESHYKRDVYPLLVQKKDEECIE